MVVKSGCKMLGVVTASASKSSLPGALWFLRELMAAMISSFFGGPVSTLRSPQLLVYRSGSSSGAGLLRTSLKCSTQRASWPFSEVRSCPCLSRMGTFLLPLYFPMIKFLFPSLLHPQAGFTCFIEDVPHLLPLLIYSVSYVTQGMEPVHQL